MAEKKPSASANAGRLTPLWIISLFVGLSETVLGVAATQITGNLQVALVAFVMIFPTICAAAFFAILWDRPWVFYSPNEYAGVDPTKFVETLSQVHFAKVTKTADLPNNITVVGDPDAFALLFKANGPTWKKSTKAMAVAGGCLVQVSTEVLGTDGSTGVAEALAFIPDASIENDPAGEGRHLVPAGRVA